MELLAWIKVACSVDDFMTTDFEGPQIGSFSVEVIIYVADHDPHIDCLSFGVEFEVKIDGVIHWVRHLT